MKIDLRGGRLVALPLFVLLGCLSGGGADASEGDHEVSTAEWSMDTIRQRVEVDSATELHFEHHLGDVRIKVVESGGLSVIATAQRHLEDPREAQVRSVVEGDSMHLTIEFANLEVMETEAWAGRRIDVGLAVPKGMKLIAKTSSGLLEVERGEAPVTMTSTTGDLVYEGFGNVDASSDSGSVRARFYDATKTEQAKFSTVTGDVHVQLLAGAEATFNLSTAGTIASDYSMTIDRTPGTRLKRGRVQLGENGPQISIESARGDIRLEGLLAPDGTGPSD